MLQNNLIKYFSIFFTTDDAEEELKDCHYRRETKVADSKTSILEPMNSNKPSNFELFKPNHTSSFELVSSNKQSSGCRTDSVYILPHVRFISLNGTEIPVLDENAIFKQEKSCKSSSSIKEEFSIELKTESTILTDV